MISFVKIKKKFDFKRSSSYINWFNEDGLCNFSNAAWMPINMKTNWSCQLTCSHVNLKFEKSLLGIKKNWVVFIVLIQTPTTVALMQSVLPIYNFSISHYIQFCQSSHFHGYPFLLLAFQIGYKPLRIYFYRWNFFVAKPGSISNQIFSWMKLNNRHIIYYNFQEV